MEQIGGKRKHFGDITNAFQDVKDDHCTKSAKCTAESFMPRCDSNTYGGAENLNPAKGPALQDVYPLHQNSQHSLVTEELS